MLEKELKYTRIKVEMWPIGIEALLSQKPYHSRVTWAHKISFRVHTVVLTLRINFIFENNGYTLKPKEYERVLIK